MLKFALAAFAMIVAIFGKSTALGVVYSKRVTQRARASTGLVTVTSDVAVLPSTVAVTTALPRSFPAAVSALALIDALTLYAGLLRPSRPAAQHLKQTQIPPPR